MIARLIAFVLAIALPIPASAADPGSEPGHSGGALSAPAVPASKPLAEAERLTKQAGSLYQQGQYAQAEPLIRQALAIREKALVPDHPAVAESLNNLALLSKQLGRYGEAEALFRRSVAIRENAL